MGRDSRVLESYGDGGGGGRQAKPNAFLERGGVAALCKIDGLL